jgi:protein-tyrosine phosphatase
MAPTADLTAAVRSISRRLRYPEHAAEAADCLMSADIYWITGVPCGRLAILGRPRAGDWLADEITDWATNGLTDVVSLLEDHEVRDLELTREAELVRHAGLDFERFPIADRGVPTSLEKTHDLWRRLEVKLRNERSVGIHCRASIGRAGMVAVGTLLRFDVAEDVAWQYASMARGRQVPDTDEQRLWIAKAFRRPGVI